nr:LysM domain-containing protein [Heliomicrobium gestii]
MEKNGSTSGEWGQSGVELYLVSLDLGSPDRERERVGSVDAEMELLQVARRDDEVRANIRLQVRAIMEPVEERSGRDGESSLGVEALQGKGEPSGSVDSLEKLSLIEREIPLGPKMFRQEQMLVVQMPGPSDEQTGEGESYAAQEASALSILYIHPYWSENRLKVDLLLSVGLVSEGSPNSRSVQWMEQTIRIEGEGLPEEAKVVAFAWRVDRGEGEATTELRTQVAYLSDERDPMGILEKVTSFSSGILWLGEPRLSLNASNWEIHGPAWLLLPQLQGAEDEGVYGEVPAEPDSVHGDYGAIELNASEVGAEGATDGQTYEEIASTSDGEVAESWLSPGDGVFGDLATVADGDRNGLNLARNEVDAASEEATVTAEEPDDEGIALSDRAYESGALGGATETAAAAAAVDQGIPLDWSAHGELRWDDETAEITGAAPIPELIATALPTPDGLAYGTTEYRRPPQADPLYREWAEYPTPPAFDGDAEYPLPETYLPQVFHDEAAAAQEASIPVAMNGDETGAEEVQTTELIGGYADYLDSTIYTIQYDEGFLQQAAPPSLAPVPEPEPDETIEYPLYGEAAAESLQRDGGGPDLAIEAETSMVASEEEGLSIRAEESGATGMAEERETVAASGTVEQSALIEVTELVEEVDVAVEETLSAEETPVVDEAPSSEETMAVEKAPVTEGTLAAEKIQESIFLGETAPFEFPVAPESMEGLISGGERPIIAVEAEDLAGEAADASDEPAGALKTQPLSLKPSLPETPRITSRFRDRPRTGEGALGNKINHKEQPEQPQPLPAVRRLARPLPDLPTAVNPAPAAPAREPKPRDIRRIQRPSDDMHKIAAAAKPTVDDTRDGKGNRNDSGWRFVVVGAGDTISSIARRNRIPEELVRSINKLSTDDTLQAGQTLMIPRQRM